MSTTTNVQSFLPYVFRPTYTSNLNGFKTSFNIRNVDTITAGTLSVGQLQIGDSNSNMYIGSSSGTAVLATTNNSNTVIGFNAGLGLESSTSLEALGFGAAQTGRIISNSSFVGTFAGSNACNVSASYFVGTYAGSATSNITNSIFLGSNSGGSGSNVLNSLFIGNGTGANSFNASNVIAIGISTAAWSSKTTTGVSNIFIGNSTATGLTGSGNIIIGHGLTAATIPTYQNFYGDIARSVPANMSNKLYIGSGAGVLLAGDLSTGYVSIGSTNTSPVSCNSGNYSIEGTGLQLDVAKYMRIGQGLGIGVDPTAYQLDVNGTFHISDGTGGDLEFMPTPYGSANGALTLKTNDPNGSMTLNVIGRVNASHGVYSLLLTPANAVTIPHTTNNTYTLSNVLPAKNGSNWSGYIVGTILSGTKVNNTISQFFTGTYTLIAGVPVGSNTSTTGLTWTVSNSSNIVITNTTSITYPMYPTDLPVYYNFTFYPAY